MELVANDQMTVMQIQVQREVVYPCQYKLLLHNGLGSGSERRYASCYPPKAQNCLFSVTFAPLKKVGSVTAVLETEASAASCVPALHSGQCQGKRRPWKFVSSHKLVFGGLNGILSDKLLTQLPPATTLLREAALHCTRKVSRTLQAIHTKRHTN